MAKILVVGLNPAWQSVMAFAELRPGRVNRATESVSFASGKGINAAKVLKRLGHEVHILQILGGENGRRCLGGCLELGLHSLDVWVETETRQCSTLRDLGNGQVTELIAPFTVGRGAVADDRASAESDSAAGNSPDRKSQPLLGEPERITAELLNRVDSSEGYAAVVVCGSVPAGLPASILPDILRKVCAPIAVVDAWQGFAGEDLGLATCFKLNREENASLCGKMGWAPPDYDSRRVTDWVAAKGGPGANFAAPAFLVTAGPDVAWMLRQGRKPLPFQPPAIDRVENSTGAGDTVAAGLADGLVNGLELEDAFHRSLAMGSASCMLPNIAEFREEDFLSLLAKVPTA